MTEDTIWKGTCSPWKISGAFVFLILSIPASIVLQLWLEDKGVGLWPYLLIVVAALWLLWRWVELKTTVFHLTNERLLITSGILTKVTNTLELYRVRDLKVVQPLWLRMVGLQNIELYTADTSTEIVIIDYVRESLTLPDRLRQYVEACRAKKNVRVMDVIDDETGDAPVGQ